MNKKINVICSMIFSVCVFYFMIKFIDCNFLTFIKHIGIAFGIVLCFSIFMSGAHNLSEK